MKSKTIIVTGGASGIGLATAQMFAKKNYNVYVLDINPIKHPSENIYSMTCDVSNPVQINNAICAILKESDTIDALFANAGIHFYANIEETTTECLGEITECLGEIIDVNVKGVFDILKAVLPYMKKQNYGAVVISGSDQSLVGKKNSAAYGLTKAAVAQLAKSTALDYAQWNIRINCICPGAIKTALYDQAVKTYAQKHQLKLVDLENKIKANIPLQRVGKPEEVAELVYFLCSDKAQYITGISISIDGGYCAQ